MGLDLLWGERKLAVLLEHGDLADLIFQRLLPLLTIEAINLFGDTGYRLSEERLDRCIDVVQTFVDFCPQHSRVILRKLLQVG